MTLPEAYQRLRREAISLRRENAKLKDGTYTDPEKAAHEEKIRKLNLENKNLIRMSRKYHDLWRHALDFPRGLPLMISSASKTWRMKTLSSVRKTPP